jgi:hypothetical protein
MFNPITARKKISTPTWAALAVVGTAAVLLWLEPLLEPVSQFLEGRSERPRIEVAPELLQPAAEEREGVHTDFYGDSLPPGAIARMGTVRLYDEGRVGCFVPGGRLLAVGGPDGTIRFWNTATGREWRTFHDNPVPIQWLAFSHDGRLMASAGSSDRYSCLWDVLAGKPLRRLKHGYPVLRCDFAADGGT